VSIELTGGTLAAVVPFHTSNILFLLGGGRSPLYPPNKVIVWDDAIGSEVAELEFRERVRGIACRRGWLAVSLRRRVVVFEVGDQVTRYGEWDTCDNPRGKHNPWFRVPDLHVAFLKKYNILPFLPGLLAMATGAYTTLLAIAGRQLGHVQLVHLPPCPPPPKASDSSSAQKPPPMPTKSPISMIIAHESALTTLALPPSGRLLATTSTRGTLVRLWDSLTGKLLRELRRGSDKAEIYGVAFRPDERELCVWSDKGTVHVFTLFVSGASYDRISFPFATSLTCYYRNRQSTFSSLTPYLPLPKYFGSEWSYAQYRIPVQTSHISISASRSATADVPDEERCVVGWVEAPTGNSSSQSNVGYQLIALTYTGGWYRLSLPSHGVSSTPYSTPISGSPPKLPSVARQRTPSGSSMMARTDKGKEKEREKEGKESTDCVLQEFRRFGRWDGWG